METSWYNPLPAYLGWIGIAVVAIVFGYLWYRMRKAKNAESEFTHWTVRINGFGNVYVPKEELWTEEGGAEHPDIPLVSWPILITSDRASVMAYRLANARTDVWLKMHTLYSFVPKGEWPVTYLKIENTVVAMPSGHKHVVWNAPHGSMKLLLADDMVYWFARECHNVFRCMMHGIDNIYNTIDLDDLEKATQVEKWISDTYHE